ncbi:MAG TPA: hypothetical protein VMV49_05215, partial [Candidatus Deferrimicrobium sp.]|nr:hypothetical protein [Candidatus Deferrimicrobium sp.]
QRIQLFDVTDKVKQGNNVICAECYNYFIPRVAGNIYLEIEYENGEREVILSNTDWKANSLQEESWLGVEFDDSQWQNAKSLGAPPKISGHVTKPHLQAGLKSQESYYYGMDSFMKGMLPWVPLRLIALGVKIIGLDIF